MLGETRSKCGGALKSDSGLRTCFESPPTDPFEQLPPFRGEHVKKFSIRKPDETEERFDED